MPVVPLPNGRSMVTRDALTVRGRYDLDPAYADMMHELYEAFPEPGALKALDLSDPATAEALVRGTTGKFVRASKEFELAAILGFVLEWNLTTSTGAPIPVTRDGIMSIEDDEVYRAIVKAIYPLAIKAMGVDLSFTVDGATDPSSPTEPSSASSGGERAAAVPSTSLMPTPSGSSESTSSAA